MAFFSFPLFSFHFCVFASGAMITMISMISGMPFLWWFLDLARAFSGDDSSFFSNYYTTSSNSDE